MTVRLRMEQNSRHCRTRGVDLQPELGETDPNRSRPEDLSLEADSREHRFPRNVGPMLRRWRSGASMVVAIVAGLVAGCTAPSARPAPPGSAKASSPRAAMAAPAPAATIPA